MATSSHLDFAKNSLSLEPFNRFAPNFHCEFWKLRQPVSTRLKQANYIKIYRNILYRNFLQKTFKFISVIILIWLKTKWCPKWSPPRYCCLLYIFNRNSVDFHQIFTKNLEIYFPLRGICYNFNMVENKMASIKAFT